MLIKICGLRDEENIRSIVALSADWLGFIFYEKSPRYVGNLWSQEEIRSIPNSIITTGVFVDNSIDNISRLVENYNFRAVQLHGNESPDFCRSLKQELGPTVRLMKAFGIHENYNFRDLESYERVVDLFLFDTQSPQKGGTGKTFDWNLLMNYKGEIPFFLSGGIGLEELKNLQEEIDEPFFKYLVGLDLNSKLEKEPGLKNIEKVQKAIDLVHQWKR